MSSPANYTATIANGASLSGAVDMLKHRLSWINMPSAWTAASLTFQVSPDGVAFANLYDATGAEYSVPAAASEAIVLNLLDFIGVRYLKVRSGTAGTPVTQAAARTLTLTGVV